MCEVCPAQVSIREFVAKVNEALANGATWDELCEDADEA